jgi:excisionase family DNA binding protein
VSVKAAAAYLSCSPWLIRRLVEVGELTPVRLAGARRVLIDRLALDALVDGQHVRGARNPGELPPLCPLKRASRLLLGTSSAAAPRVQRG